MIAELEAVSRSAWPARVERDYDGWRLCLGGGRTRRTNSVQPVAAGRLPLEAKIDYCEAYYRDADVRPVFKLTEAAAPPELDRALAERGYVLSDPTSVQRVSLGGLAARGDAPAVRDAVRIDSQLTPAWLSECAALWKLDADATGALAEVLERISLDPGPSAFALRAHAHETVAQGLGVVRGEFVYLAQVVTQEAARKSGHARAVVLRICAWARDAGARTALLQVVAANARAIALYEGLGFAEVYRYWYREAPDRV